MTTSISNLYSLSIRCNGQELLSCRLDPFQLPYRASDYLCIKAADTLSFRLGRPPDAGPVLVKLGEEQVMLCSGRQSGCESQEDTWLYNEIGESCLTVEQQSPGDENELSQVIIEIPIVIEPRSPIARDYEVMVEDLTRVHEDLARDIISKSHSRFGLRASGTLRLVPASVLARFAELHQRLVDVVDRIASQPSHVLTKRRVVARYRPGDQIDTCGLHRFAENSFDAEGRATAIQKGHVRRSCLSADTPEHRHLACGIRLLEKRANVVARHFSIRAEMLQLDAKRWGTTSGKKPSVFQETILPKIRQLEEYAAKAGAISSGLHALLLAHPFLKDAEEPRTPFCLTPTFSGRPAYRAAYQILSEARTVLGVLVDGDAIRVGHRSLSSLYEYWCFIKTVELLRDRLGTPKPDPTIKLIHGVYRPELLPGQKFIFGAESGKTVAVSYEPDINPWRKAVGNRERYGASLTARPLRPDIMVEVASPGERSVVLVLDAKSTEKFTLEKFRETTDYSRQIIEVEGLAMPVRQVFLLHRDAGCAELLNLPTYFQQSEIPRENVIVGGVSCLPERVGCVPLGLERVVDKFLDLYVRSTLGNFR